MHCPLMLRLLRKTDSLIKNIFNSSIFLLQISSSYLLLAPILTLISPVIVLFQSSYLLHAMPCFPLMETVGLVSQTGIRREVPFGMSSSQLQSPSSGIKIGQGVPGCVSVHGFARRGAKHVEGMVCPCGTCSVLAGLFLTWLPPLQEIFVSFHIPLRPFLKATRGTKPVPE